MTREEQAQRLPVVLIVEDHAPVRELLQHMLSREFPVCRVVSSATAEQALELCVELTPRAVVMDISLPGMDGIEATRRLRVLLPGCAVVVHSSHDEPIYREAAVLAGASAFVAKSRTFSELIPAVRAALDPASPRR